ncbi:hypothetical protein [Azospirillum sp. BE72]|uniref:hypothetical protein n=1 Tax=Azospirillum sp. BE72 TaxID=2817776 RepID=UPI002854FB9C|nr:hypothetical protein [Azospirillum sp. BE72]MDR6773929.1 hypothetical protein [Azospirillum sp. BE72]
MTDSDRNDLTAALADVRRAYRLLWGYQKRILHIVAEIREQLGFIPSSIEYQFDPPDQKIEDPSRWMWDALPFSMIGFEAEQGEGRAQCGSRMLYIDVVSDTGLAQEKNRSGNKWEPKPDRFQPPEDCRSELRLYILQNSRERDENFAWHRDVVVEVGHWKAEGAAYRDASTGVLIYGETIDLIELGNRAALAARIDRFHVSAQTQLNALSRR